MTEAPTVLPPQLTLVDVRLDIRPDWKRERPPGEVAIVAGSLWEIAFAMQAALVRRDHPDADDREVWLIHLAEQVDLKTRRGAYGTGPDSHRLARVLSWAGLMP